MFTFFLRDKSKINIFGIDDTDILETPSKLNEDFGSIGLDEQANQSSKWKDLNLDQQNMEKYANIEKTLLNSSKMLRDYGKHSNPSEVEEQKEILKSSLSDDEDELGQINERETESGGNNDKNQQKLEEYFEEISKNILDDEDEKQEERFENISPYHAETPRFSS